MHGCPEKSKCIKIKLMILIKKLNRKISEKGKEILLHYMAQPCLPHGTTAYMAHE
jgi:hypothetical protein